MRFSERIGQTPIRTALQLESIDERLLNRLWNVINEDFFNKLDDFSYDRAESQFGTVAKLIWKEFYGERIDQIPSYDSGLLHKDGFMVYVESWYFSSAKWFQVYDFIELLAIMDKNALNNGFTQKCNVALKKEVSAYRIVESQVLQITSEEEIVAIEQALGSDDNLRSVNMHLKSALQLLSNRQAPNYRNSIKESISAVEALCRIIAQDEKATLGKALAVIEKKYSLHGSLKEAYSRLYGYTSDADGIRHALLEDGVSIEFEDAKFMLVSCSAFINYLKAKLKL